MKTNYHTHTYRCGHADYSMSDEDYTTWEGFGITDFERIALYQKNRPNGYQLNPLLAENERPLKDNDNNTWECIGYSDVLNNHTNSWFIIGNMDMEYTWGYCLSEDGKDSDNFMVYPNGITSNHLAIDNGKEYAAHCRYKTMNDGDIFFGNSDEYIEWLEALEPLSFSYKEPCFEYGMDFHEVLKYMCRFSGQTVPIMQDEDYYYITYRLLFSNYGRFTFRLDYYSAFCQIRMSCILQTYILIKTKCKKVN